MTTNYDPIAEQYKRSKQTPWRTHIECFTLLETIGRIDGLDRGEHGRTGGHPDTFAYIPA